MAVDSAVTTCARIDRATAAAKSGASARRVTLYDNPATATVDHRLYADREAFDHALAEQIDPWVPGGLYALGTDGMGRSDTREALVGAGWRVGTTVMPGSETVHGVSAVSAVAGRPGNAKLRAR